MWSVGFFFFHAEDGIHEQRRCRVRGDVYKREDRFRVKALEKMISSGELNNEQKKATVDILIQKCEIISNGMKKRKKDNDVLKWEEKLKIYLSF